MKTPKQYPPREFQVKVAFNPEEESKLRLAAYEAKLCLATLIRRVLMSYLDGQA